MHARERDCPVTVCGSQCQPLSDDFMFRLTAEEMTRLRSQFVTLETGRGNS
jgi:hypothetical protein